MQARRARATSVASQRWAIDSHGHDVTAMYKMAAYGTRHSGLMGKNS